MLPQYSLVLARCSPRLLSATSYDHRLLTSLSAAGGVAGSGCRSNGSIYGSTSCPRTLLFLSFRFSFNLFVLNLLALARQNYPDVALVAIENLSISSLRCFLLLEVS